MKKSLFALLIGFSIIGTMNSCSDDEPDAIRGCTEEGAENYNPNATESDGNCVYARDKFLGQYLGSLKLATFSQLDQNDVVFEITPGIASKNELIISATGQALPISFKGTASGNDINVDTEQTIPDGGSINPLLDGKKVVISFTGTVSTSDNGNNIAGPLQIIFKTPDDDQIQDLPDMAQITGVRQ